MKKVQTKSAVKVRAYEVIWRAVNEGVGYGYQRAHKHTDKPSEEHVRDQIEQAVMNALCEILDFGDED